jgi:VanZ family protein
MSDVIETGALRKSGDKRKSRSKVLGKRSKATDKRPAIDRSKDELELGRFEGNSTEKKEPAKPASPELGEVVGARRKKVTSDEAKAARRRSGAELEIGTTRDISKDAEPTRPLAKRRSRPPGTDKKSWIGFAILVALSGLLVALSIAIFLFMPRYELIGELLIDNPAFANDLDGWERQGVVAWDEEDPAKVVLDRRDLETPTVITKDIPLPDGDSVMILRAEVQGDDVRPGPEVWDQARIYLAQVDADGSVLWGEDHNLFLMDGTTEIRNYSRAYSIPSEIQTARLGIEMKNATGRLTVSKLQLSEAKRPTAFLITAGCLLLAWTALILYSGQKTLRGIESVQLRIWLAVTAVLSIIAIMLPGNLYTESWQVFAYRFGLEDLDINSLAHGVIFAALAFIVRLGRPADPIWLHIAAWLPIAVASEVMQLFTIEREPSLYDLVLDMAGVLVGLALAEAGRQLERFRVA